MLPEKENTRDSAKIYSWFQKQSDRVKSSAVLSLLLTELSSPRCVLFLNIVHADERIDGSPA